MKASICMSTYNRPEALDKTLASIFAQSAPFNSEVIVVDDAGPSSAEKVCQHWPVRYVRLDRDGGYRNPAVARNVAYRMARGEVVICQSDDVIHGPEAIRRLVGDLRRGEFLLAKVWNVNEQREIIGIPEWPTIKQMAGPRNRRPLFFLGAITRENLYAVGGCDEEFVDPGYEDDWLAMCLTRGIGLVPRWSKTIVGYHQSHRRPATITASYHNSKTLYQQKMRLANLGEIPWLSVEGPWPLRG